MPGEKENKFHKFSFRNNTFFPVGTCNSKCRLRREHDFQLIRIGKMSFSNTEYPTASIQLQGTLYRVNFTHGEAGYQPASPW